VKTNVNITKTLDGGFSLIELLIVIGIISILLAFAAINGKQWMDKYNAEKQLRIMHADLLQARTSAMDQNMRYFVVITANNYQVIKDANGNGKNDDTVLFQTPLHYQATTPMTLIIDQKGLLSTSTSSLPNLPDIKFNTADVTPEYDCIQLYATRINIGKMIGANCVPR
jgi:prepilin-type N-terminal cleavage/methylation domain-containing protein